MATYDYFQFPIEVYQVVAKFQNKLEPLQGVCITPLQQNGNFLFLTN